MLNAKQHEREASIVAQAGRKGAVTISTNMAGRGTDIMLGGNPEVLARSEADPVDRAGGLRRGARALPRDSARREREEVLAAGGLHILGTERHESRRIDNQLRGRSGRQGDPGSSRFFLSLEDDLMRIFGADRIKGLMGRLGMEEDEPIEHRMVTRAIENAQKKVEGHNFDIRKNLLEYDDVMNQQRKAIYTLRRDILARQGGHATTCCRSADDVARLQLIDAHCPEKADPVDWNLSDLAHRHPRLLRPRRRARWASSSRSWASTSCARRSGRRSRRRYDDKEARLGRELMRALRARHHAARRRPRPGRTTCWRSTT